MQRCRHVAENYGFHHFSAHEYLPNGNKTQLQVNNKFLALMLDDVTCSKNITQWDCLLPDWAEKINFSCRINSTCIEDCALIIEANLQHYLIYAGILIVMANVTVLLAERWVKKYNKKNP